MSTGADGKVIMRVAAENVELRARVEQLEKAQARMLAILNAHAAHFDDIVRALAEDDEEQEGTMLQ